MKGSPSYWTTLRRLIFLQATMGAGSETLTVTGISPLALVNAVAHALVSLTQTGKCAQASTPTPASPVDIKCNNGALRVVDDELPSGYRRVLGFTCNNNAMWQITGFKLRGSDTVKISFSVTAACNVWGCYQSTSATDNYDLYATTTAGGKYLRYADGTYASYFSNENQGKRFDVTYTPTGTTGMPEDSTWTERTFESANDLLLGSTTIGGTSSKLKGNLYGEFIVENAGVERLHLIPCERRSDNVLGYYDLVSEAFFEPYTGFDGAASLGYDNSHHEIKVVGTPEVISLTGNYDSRLPSGFTPLEYVSSSGVDEYVDTGIVLDSFDLDVECVVKFNNSATTTPKMAWAYMGGSANLPRWGFGGYTSKWLASVNNTTSAGSFDQNKHSAKLSVFEDSGTPKYMAAIDGEDIYPSASSIQNVDLFTSNTLSVFLFARNNNGTPGNFSECQIYGFKVTKAGTVTHELIPAKNASGVVGFYDLNTHAFLTNGGETALGSAPKYNEIGTAGTEDLLAAGAYADTQEIISGAVARKCGIVVLDGTEGWSRVSDTRYQLKFDDGLAGATATLSTHFVYSNSTSGAGKIRIASSGYLQVVVEATTLDGFKNWLAAQYAAGTPVIVVYPLATPTTESVAGQELATAAGTNTITVTAEVSDISLTCEYKGLAA